MHREDILRKQHESVAPTENKRMRKNFNMRTYKSGDQWGAQQTLKAQGAKGGKIRHERPWVAKVRG